MKSSAQTVRDEIKRVNALHAEYLSDAEFGAQFREFLDWQARYLSAQYRDLIARAEYQQAAAFVINDLTGFDVNQRDRDLGRIVPLMSRVLPDAALGTLASALQLNAGALALNLAICRQLDASAIDTLTEQRYADAVRNATDRGEALSLCQLTIDVGRRLAQIVALPMIGTTLASMRMPARLMGFAALHEFLATGFRLFRELPDSEKFLTDLDTRMRAIHARLYDAPLDSLATEPLPPEPLL